MALIVADRVRETTSTTGTGSFSLGGAQPGFQAFSAVMANGDTTYYACASASDWEVGVGTWNTGNTLSRTTILASSNGGSAVNFGAGSKDIFISYPASRSVYRNEADTTTVQQTFSSLSATSATLTSGTVATTPTSATDIANKTYVDTMTSSGITYHSPVKYEVPVTTGNLTATYNNGAAGVGATLTNAGTLTAFTPDGVVASVNDRILIYSQTNAFENGVYTVTTVGSGSVAWVLTRATDADTYALKSPNALGLGDAFFITSGNTGAGETYVCNTSGTITFGTTAINFVQVSSAQIYSAGTGLTLSGTQFSITNTGVGAATYGSASAVPVIGVNAQGQITSATNTTIAITGAQVSGNIAGSAGSVANALTAGSYLTSGGTFDGSVARTFAVDADTANTASKVVARDGSGNFSAGTITASLTGNASSATNLAGGAANRIPYQTSAGTTTFVAAPTIANTYLSWTGSAYTWADSGNFNNATITGTLTISSGTANGVGYLNASKQFTTGSVLTFDGAQLGVNGVTVGRGGGAVSTNTVVGASALATNTTGAFNVAVGTEALYSTTTSSLTAVGYRAGYAHLGAAGGTYVGYFAGGANTTGSSNTAIGFESLRFNTSGTGGTAVGAEALRANTTGGANTAVGYLALRTNTTAGSNTAVGYQALYLNTTGASNSSIGNQSLRSNTTGNSNSSIGDQSLYTNTTGSNNTGLGYRALHLNTTGYSNTAIGNEALYANTTATEVTAVGAGALHDNTTGLANDAFGAQALYSNTTGAGNTAVGGWHTGTLRSALYANTTGNYNVGISTGALGFNTTGSSNVAIGRQALGSNTTASFNTAVGYQAGYSNVSAGSTIIGYQAGYSATDTIDAIGYQAAFATTTGANNLAFGVGALRTNTTGSNNVAIGRQALEFNTTASNNTAVGYNTLSFNTTGTYNTAVGGIDVTSYSALNVNTTGSYNTGLGHGALAKNTTASYNTAVGYQAAYTNATGTGLTAVGYQALYAKNNGAATALGYQAGLSATTGNITAVGYQALQANTVGTKSTAVGQEALWSTTTGSNNSAFGHQTGYGNTTGADNSAFGAEAFSSNTTGSSNTVMGALALSTNTTGFGNTAIGTRALIDSTTSNYNTAVGFYASVSNTTGTANVSLGKQALFSSTTGSYNTAVGADALTSSSTASNNTAVGYQAGYSQTTADGNALFGYQAGTSLTTGNLNSFFGAAAGGAITTGSKHTIIGRYNGNQGGLDIRTASNYIVLSDGDGNPRAYWNGANATFGGTLAATIYYDSDDTGYYIDPASTSNTALRMRGGALFGPNTTWGAYLSVGTNGHASGSYASVVTTNGNLHLDAVSGSATYINYYAGSNVYFGNGASGGIYAQIGSDGSFRSPIFYDYNNTAYYVDPAGSTSGSFAGFVGIGNNYGSDDGGWGSRLNVGGTSYARIDARCATDGIVTTIYSHVGQNRGYVGTMSNHRLALGVNGSEIQSIYSSYSESIGSYRAPIFYDSNNTSYYVDPASTSVLSALNLNSAGTALFRYLAPGQGTVSINAPFYWNAATGSINIAMIDNDTGGVVIDNEGVTVYGAGDTGGVFRVIDEDVWQTNGNNVDAATCFYVNQGTTGGWGRGSWNFYGDVRSPIFYDSDNTGYYVDPSSGSYLYGLILSGNSYFRPNTWIQMDSAAGLYWPNHYGAHLYSNTGSTYTQIRLDGQKNGYDGMWLSYSAVNGMMYDSGGNGGVYREANGRWFFYYNVSNDCMGIGTSSTSSTYSLYLTKGIYAQSGIYINHSSPTLYLQDTDNRSSMVHANGGYWLVLRGDGTNSTSWATYNGYWPLRIYVENNDALFGGNLEAIYNVTAYSDERLKKNWRAMPENFIERLARVRNGIYDRIAKESEPEVTQVGVSAQSLREVLPEAVLEAADDMKTLSVAYGNAALAACVELAKEIVALKAEISALRAKE